MVQTTFSFFNFKGYIKKASLFSYSVLRVGEGKLSEVKKLKHQKARTGSILHSNTNFNSVVQLNAFDVKELNYINAVSRKMHFKFSHTIFSYLFS